MTIAERLIESGRKEGREEGREEGWMKGLHRGQEEGERALLRKLLEKRFGTLSPQQLQRLQSADLQTLEHWGTQIFDITSVQEILGPR